MPECFNVINIINQLFAWFDWLLPDRKRRVKTREIVVIFNKETNRSILHEWWLDAVGSASDS